VNARENYMIKIIAEIASCHNGDIELAKNGASITSITLDTDRVWGLVMEK